MPEIDRNINEHCLSVNPDVRKVWQKRRSISAEKYIAIVEENRAIDHELHLGSPF